MIMSKVLHLFDKW